MGNIWKPVVDDFNRVCVDWNNVLGEGIRREFGNLIVMADTGAPWFVRKSFRGVRIWQVACILRVRGIKLENFGIIALCAVAAALFG